jgi:hypothetical protein
MEKADLPISNPEANVPVALRKLLLLCMKLVVCDYPFIISNDEWRSVFTSTFIIDYSTPADRQVQYSYIAQALSPFL